MFVSMWDLDLIKYALVYCGYNIIDVSCHVLSGLYVTNICKKKKTKNRSEDNYVQKVSFTVYVCMFILA